MVNLLKNTNISLYKSNKDTIGSVSNLYEVLNTIKSHRFKNITEEIRSKDNKRERDYIKSKLKAATFSGVFSSRSKQNCIDASGIVCLDFDSLEDVCKVKNLLIKDNYCLACWVSPSGNGLKLLVKIPLVIGDERYKEYYNAALDYYKSFNPDISTKDISRLCYISYDPDIFINERSIVFKQKKISVISKPKVRNFKPICATSENSTIKILFNWWVKKHWNPNCRNTSLYKLAAAFCEFGISQDSAWSIIKTYQETDLREYELRSVLKSAYKRVSFNSKKLA